jgi:ribosomal protein S18 acetylase RimI-like enzyme
MIDIKRLTREDGLLMKQIVEKFKSVNTDINRIDAFLRNDLDYVVACIEDNVVVGFLLAYELQRFDKNNMMYVHEVDVVPEYRRRGIGRQMIEEVIRICEECGVYKLFLITNKSNVPACRLYEVTGGKVVEDDSILYCYEEL